MRGNKIGLLLAAAAAYGAYKYSKLTPGQKNDLMAKGKDLLNRTNELIGKSGVIGEEANRLLM